jgi:hypothetical protein
VTLLDGFNPGVRDWESKGTNKYYFFERMRTRCANIQSQNQILKFNEKEIILREFIDR